MGIPPAAVQTIRSAVLDAHELHPDAPDVIARHIIRAITDAGWQITPIPPTDDETQETSPMPRKTDPAAVARTARNAVEKLNHATLAAGIPAPVVSSATQAVLGLVQHLPQTLDQLGGAIQARHREGRIHMDDGTDPAAAALEITAALGDAVRALEQAATAIQRASGPMFHMAAK
ncbi:hypothetical protein [Kitasatospora sp. NPDC058046]|uniref:hypothetical protein n=1 Tax=Kitasatospora sp. NPDC058046 TaxID=3346312 RepID=UPI0036DEF9E5